ncbi:hypothetical protein KBZ18_02595 [Synechococcus sp. Cruz-9H2]|uniref:hypothetical protein n=1 Tax=unclassified Synechococcus TaxID=2626047 RepID=UPI0020CC7A23|nr:MULTISPECIES: hypothetical protein [unclassified Synechococcus]MCP9818380.1 hypothetical protein [Synechococcus sp. Cruz-9H2]MCP9842121.1 hypothetical protein [Synechococcus sp. Edmonson 11F2]MCP9854776.1 hypothetical protein [Synechococcus sp. Cruz-9C9]MCP9861529.1 hypothetical protein [Synechococcus sp. Cruz-7E5]MCP9869288.1 hypothetical protein [Synechococcus sp. Cruz-7B9]
MTSPSTSFQRPPRSTPNQEQAQLRQFLEELLRAGFNPKYMVSYHPRSPEETGWHGKGQPAATSASSRHRPTISAWNQVGSYEYYKRRRNDVDCMTTDNQHIRNLVMRRHYGIQRLNQDWREAPPPMLFFMEQGIGVQQHVHLLLPQPLPQFDSAQSLTAEWKLYMTKHAKCLSRQRPPHVCSVTDAAGVMGYLTKETSSERLVLDVTASNFLSPASP